MKIDTSRRVNAFTAIRQARTCRISVEPHDVIARKIGAFPRGLTIGRSAPITSSTSLPDFGTPVYCNCQPLDSRTP